MMMIKIIIIILLTTFLQCSKLSFIPKKLCSATILCQHLLLCFLSFPFLLLQSVFHSSIIFKILSLIILSNAKPSQLSFFCYLNNVLDIYNLYSFQIPNLLFFLFPCCPLSKVHLWANNLFALSLPNVQVSVPYNMTLFNNYLKISAMVYLQYFDAENWI